MQHPEPIEADEILSGDHGDHGDLGDHGGLVRLETAPSSSRRWDIGLLLIFLCVTLLAGLVDALLPIDIPSLVGEEKAKRQARWQAVHWQDGSLARWIEEDRHLRSRIRHHLLPPYALLLYQAAGEVRGELMLGKDGWLFLRDRVEPRREDDEAILQQSADVLYWVQQRAAERGSRVLIVPLPRKAALASTQLPRGIDARPQLDRQLPGILAAQGVDFVDLLPLLDRLPETCNEAPYFRGDSHLTQCAMRQSAEVIADQLGLAVPQQQRTTEVRALGGQPAEYDLLRFVGIRLTPLTRRLASFERLQAFEILDDAVPLRPLQDPHSGAGVALVGTSFSTVTELSTFLSHAIDQPVFDAAEPGKNPFQILHELMKPDSEPLPPIIVLEVPNHVLFDNHGLEVAEAWLASP